MVLQRQLGRRPKLNRWDRLLFAALYHVQPVVLRSISIARPETVVVWHRAGFRLFWPYKSRGRAGRPRVPVEVRRLIRDRVRACGNDFRKRLSTMGIRDGPTAPWSPWQIGYVERLIGSIRRELLGHVIVLGGRHLRHLLRDYADCCNTWRTHLGLEKDTPLTRPVERDGIVTQMAKLGGHYHAYVRK